MKSFEYVAPNSVKEVTALLADTWGKTEVLAGGTDLVTCLKQHLTEPERVVSLRNIKELRGIRSEKSGLRIGAMTTLAELADNKTVQAQFPALITAIKGIGSPQLVNVGTVGGDLCQRPRCWYFRNGFGLFGKAGGESLVRVGDNRFHAIFGTGGDALFVSASSLGPPLVALGASITVEGPGGKRHEIAAAEFFRAPASEKSRETSVKPDEIVTSVLVPINGLKNTTYEVRHRGGLDWPYVTASVAFRVERGVIADARVALGHVAATPWSAREAASAINGQRADAGAAAKAAAASITGAQPLSRNAYKVQLVKTAVKRAMMVAMAT